MKIIWHNTLDYIFVERRVFISHTLALPFCWVSCPQRVHFSTAPCAQTRRCLRSCGAELGPARLFPRAICTILSYQQPALLLLDRWRNLILLIRFSQKRFANLSYRVCVRFHWERRHFLCGRERKKGYLRQELMVPCESWRKTYAREMSRIVFSSNQASDYYCCRKLTNCWLCIHYIGYNHFWTFFAKTKAMVSYKLNYYCGTLGLLQTGIDKVQYY